MNNEFKNLSLEQVQDLSNEDFATYHQFATEQAKFWNERFDELADMQQERLNAKGGFWLIDFVKRTTKWFADFESGKAYADTHYLPETYESREVAIDDIAAYRNNKGDALYRLVSWAYLADSTFFEWWVGEVYLYSLLNDEGQF